jgi:hypothetical protein
MKKRWEVPKLIVLARSRPEEAVLVNCKVSQGSPPPGPGSVVFDGCVGAAPCQFCSQQGST